MRTSSRSPAFLFVAFAALLPTLGCYVETGPNAAPAPAPADQGEYVENPPPEPAPVAETQPPSPGPDFEWVAGYHAWNGHGYDWRAGHYERRPRANARHVPAHWESRGRGKVWIEARWE